MKNKIKLSNLSEGLRKELKKHLKEGKVNLSQMPEGVKKKVLREMSDQINGPNEHKGTIIMKDDGLTSNGLPSYISDEGIEVWGVQRGNDYIYFHNQGSRGFWYTDESASKAAIYEYIVKKYNISDVRKVNIKINEKRSHWTSDDFMIDKKGYLQFDYSISGLENEKNNINLPSLSEGLRKEVKKHLKEDKAKEKPFGPSQAKSIKKHGIPKKIDGYKIVTQHGEGDTIYWYVKDKEIK